MPTDTLIAKANDGPGLDPLAGKNTPQGFAASVILADASGVDITAGNPLPVSSSALTNAQLRATPVPTGIYAKNADYAPGYSGVAPGEAQASIDPHGNLIVRATTLTDEGSSRVNFANTSLAVSLGTATFTNGSRVVTGTGFTTRIIDKGDYAKLDADAESAWAQVESIESDTELTLASAYTGAGGTSNASRAMVRPRTGSGGAIAVASGACTLTSGTTINAVTSIERLVDYSPLASNIGVAVSQRIANNDTLIEYCDPSTTVKYFCRIRLTGTVNTSAICETGYNPTGAPSASETELTTVTIPNGVTTATARVFRVETLLSSTRYYCDNVLLAEHRRVGPHPNDPLLLRVSTVNGGSAPASSTTVTVDHLLAQNFNATNIVPSSQNDLNANQPPVETFTYSATGVIAINTDLMVIDCARFRSISATIALGTSGTITPQWSNTADFAVAIAATSADQTLPGLATITATSGVLRTFRVRARYLRFRLTVATTAGNTSIVANCFQSETSYGGETIQALVAQTQANEGNLVTPTASNINSAATTNATAVKTSAGTVYAISASNTNAAVRFVKLYNVNAAPTVGTTVPVLTIPIPATGVVNIQFGRTGHRFTTGIGLAITTGMADADTGAVAANEIKVTTTYI